MGFSKDNLDLVLSPVGLIVMFAYQLYCLYKYHRFPKTTVLGMENEGKKAWVESILQLQLSQRATGSTVIASNITAATFLSSVCLTLCSLLGAWLSNSSGNPFRGIWIYGNMSTSATEIKLLCLLTCFLLAFSCFLESMRQFVLASFLLTTSDSCQDAIDYAKAVVVRGGEYWFVGHRTLYFAVNLLLWFFGPIPMFAGSIILVMVLYFHDTYCVRRQRCPHEKIGPNTNTGVSG
ncbi:uncharacterized protein LOC116203060 [Punica granatum]|uniref:DUF599 domain-containing protein n=2 Tax=Punica granatum TaxID=22663 RepID=A0A218Y2V3_PUNGR|nr:uncharacterized protein LOC116203060 [Punica granatum]OWM91179.1 hypothetical protein CDL15_Pgr000122 [Punica granatum]PKI72846.1 hypothetical protein CRG98_006771 [Punica granatum]